MRVVEAVDVSKDGHLRLPARFPCIAPDQFRFDGFEECLNGCVILTISFATHGHFEAVLPQDFFDSHANNIATRDLCDGCSL